MTYALIDLGFLVVAGVAVALLGRSAGSARRRSRTQAVPPATAAVRPADARRRPGRWVPALIAGAGLVALTAVFDNVMISAGLFGYAPEKLLGPAVGLAPVEDFAYPLAAAVLLPALWRRLTREASGHNVDRGASTPATPASSTSAPTAQGSAALPSTTTESKESR
ncbi:lycopene cyclase domain-containing protein [Sinomonas sp. P10A9]|uniref:Lycopene cyclase domain-containing protein n=1 Tax=Sinomonas puerhi TaxID=3238584 RepID=A0AB39L2V5_9MICC